MKLIILLIFILLVDLRASELDHPDFNDLKSSERVEVLWSHYLDESLDPVIYFAYRPNLSELDQADQLRINVIDQKLGFKKDKLIRKIFNLSDLEARKIISHLGENFSYDFSHKARLKLKSAKRYLKKLQSFQALSKDDIKDLFHNSLALSHFQGGEYFTKLFLFCRHDRTYPCRFVIIDRFNDVLTNEKDGTPWSMPALAHSRRGLPFYMTNGYTPSGLHAIDSVMPFADQFSLFGKYRRLILNWLPDESVKSLISDQLINKEWWREASLARDNGRKYLRIHGTGRLNNDRHSNFYPHMPTAGCVSTREGTYDNEEFHDQRVILDKMMQAQHIGPVYQNEQLIKGILYVIELDDKKEPVSEKTLIEYGVL